MRWLLFVVGALLSASTTSATVGSFELTGTVHAGGRPKGDAIVWLEPASGQVAAQPGKVKKVVLDQRTRPSFRTCWRCGSAPRSRCPTTTASSTTCSRSTTASGSIWVCTRSGRSGA